MRTCRTCLREIPDDNFVLLRKDEQSVLLKTQLSICVPEIVIDKVINPILCYKCVQSLNTAHEFKVQCLETELRIDNCIKQENCENIEVSKLQSCSTTINKPFDLAVKSTTRDVIDDLNDLLDEVLNESIHFQTPGNENEQLADIDDVFTESEPEETSNTDDEQELLVHTETTVEESPVKSPKLPDSEVLSSIKKPLKKNTPLKPNKKLKRNCSFKCNICNYSSNYRHNLERHKTTHTNQKPFICDFCEYKCAYEELLKRHKLSRHSDHKTVTKPYSKGNKSIVRKNYTGCRKDEGQYLKKRVTDRKKPADVTSNRRFACHLCSYKALRYDTLKRHIVRHKNKAVHSCKKCDFKALNLSILNTHYIQHHSRTISDKIFSCNICTFKSLKKGNLQKHIERHSNNTDHHCKMCEYKALTEAKLIAHFDEYHSANHTFPDKPYSCSMCPYKCSSKDTLRKHVKKHYNIDSVKKVVLPTSKRYCCKVCPFVSAHQSSLCRHNKRLHTKKLVSL